VRPRLEHRDATGDEHTRSSFPEIVEALEELGFRRVGRIGAVVVPGGVEALARGYPPDQRELFTERAPIPSDVLRAPDGSAFVDVAWFWGWPSVRFRSLMTTGALVETVRRWDGMPPWPRSKHRSYRYADVEHEMTRSATSDRSILTADGSPAELWEAHRAQLAAQQKQGGAPVRHESLESALWLTRRAYEHDDAVVRRANRAVVILIFPVCFVLGAAAALVLDVLLYYFVLVPTAIGVLMLVVLPWAQVRLWYLRWIRPSFRDIAVRSETPSSL